MADQKPTLCVVAGPNGSGKTTTTELLLANEWGANSLYINPDNIAEQSATGTGQWQLVMPQTCWQKITDANDLSLWQILPVNGR